MVREWTDVCPECGRNLVPIYQTGSEKPERVKCTGDPTHAFAVLTVGEDTDPPWYRLGDPVRPLKED